MKHTCKKCLKKLSSKSFYKSKGRGTIGLSWLCKNCTRLEYRIRRIRNIETFKRKEKKYYQKHKTEILERRKKWYERNKIKVSAHQKVKNALFRGLLKRMPCEVCGVENPVDAHHDNYSEPLKVRWLCRMHHRRHHVGDKF